MRKLILFDLDGTITDSGPGVKGAVAYALEKMGYPEHAAQNLDRFMGPPLVPALIEFTGCSMEQAEEGVKWFHEDYDEKGIYDNSVYPGMPGLLRDLKQADCVLGIASSKPEPMVWRVLEHFGLLQYFDFIFGAPSDQGGGSEKAEIVERAIREAGYYTRRGDVVLVGDRKYDVQGAGKCGIACVGVAFGYGGREELFENGADFVVDTVPECNQLLLSIAAGELPLRSAPQAPVGGMSRGAKVWDILFPIVYMLAGNFAVGIIVGMILMASTSPGEWGGIGANMGPYLLVSMGAFNLFSIFFIGRIYRRDNRRFYRGGHPAWAWPKTLISVVMIVALSHILNYAIDITRLEHIFPGYSQSAAGVFSSVSLPLLTIYVGLLAPVAEELIFRGLLFGRLRTHLGIGWAVGISSAVFGLFHGNMIQFLYGAALGILLALIYDRSERIIVPVIAHMACNLFSVFGDDLLQRLFRGNLRKTMPMIMAAEAVVVALCVFALFFSKSRSSRK